MLAVIAVRFVCFCFLFFCLVLSVDMPSSCFLWMYLLVLYSCVVSFRPEYGYQCDIRFAKISSPQSLHGIKHSMLSIWDLRHSTTFANRNTSQIREVGSRLAKFSGRDTGCFDTTLWRSRPDHHCDLPIGERFRLTTKGVKGDDMAGSRETVIWALWLGGIFYTPYVRQMESMAPWRKD